MNSLLVNYSLFSGYDLVVTTEFIGLWQKRLTETDIAQVRTEVAAVNPYTARSYLMAGESVIREYEEKQEDERNSARIEREERTLELARTAQQQAEKAYRQSWIATAIAVAAVMVAITLISD